VRRRADSGRRLAARLLFATLALGSAASILYGAFVLTLGKQWAHEQAFRRCQVSRPGDKVQASFVALSVEWSKQLDDYACVYRMPTGAMVVRRSR
jgi:hypothetical protein